MRYVVTMLAVMLMSSVAGADVVSGFNDVVVDNSDPNNVFLSSLTYGGTTYTEGDMIFGDTSRWYTPPNGRDELWVEGDPVDTLVMPTVAGTSTPKADDWGSHADNTLWFTTTPDISSIDGIDYQETVFTLPVFTIFVFERGGNDSGTIQPILEDDSLGPALTLSGGGAPYALIGNYSGQDDYGYVYEAAEPIKGILIEASGHDALTVVAIPEPAMLTLLGVAMVVLLARRRR